MDIKLEMDYKMTNKKLTIKEIDQAKCYLIEYVLNSLDNGYSLESDFREIEAMETVAKTLHDFYDRIVLLELIDEKKKGI